MPPLKPLEWRRPLWKEGGGSDSRGKRVRGGKRSERDGHRCEYRQHRQNLKTSPEARGLPQSEGHSIGLTLSIALSLCLSFSGPVSLSVLPYTILPTTRSAVEGCASIHSKRCLRRSIPTVTLLFVIIVCSSPVDVRNFYISAFFLSNTTCMSIRFFQNGRF